MRISLTKVILVWMGIVVTGLFFAGAGYAAINPANIAGLWLFDEGSGNMAIDSSGNGNDGELMENPQWISGKFGGALEFNGSNYVVVPDSDSLDMTNAVTVMFWFKTDKDMVVFDDRQAPVGKHYLEYEVGVYPAGAVHTYTNDGAGGYDEGINVAVPDATWALDRWYHLAWTLDGTHETVYVDGVMIGEFDKPHAGTLPGDHTLEIGRRQGGGLGFMGAVDEVAVLNVAIGEADIQEAMTQGFGATAVSPSSKLATTWAAVKDK